MYIFQITTSLRPIFTEIWIYLDILMVPMKSVTLQKGELILQDEIVGFLERRVTKFGNSGKVDCPKAFLGKRVYLLVCKDE